MGTGGTPALESPKSQVVGGRGWEVGKPRSLRPYQNSLAIGGGSGFSYRLLPTTYRLFEY